MKKKFRHLYFYKYAGRKARLSVNKMAVSREVRDSPPVKCGKCAALNSSLKKNCWVCNEPLTIPESKVRKETVFALRLEVDGRVYRNTDESLSLSTRQFFEDVVELDFHQKAFEDWVKRQRVETERSRGLVRVTADYAKNEDRHRSIVAFITVLVVIGVLALMVYMFMQ
ncbi:MAG: hypothetical protein MJA29_03335 [Candidatus Omnitrophica bacterium]|nr:hypothetical protein [Candidatus Omnitrophota bacterium]